jgi:putative transposase
MVRAGIVKDPGDWPESGYAEIIKGRQRYQLLDHGKLADLLDLPTPGDVRLARQRWVAESLEQNMLARDNCWSEGLAVGNADFVQGIKDDLGIKGLYRELRNSDQGCVLRERTRLDTAFCHQKAPSKASQKGFPG